jgi:cytochrome c
MPRAAISGLVCTIFLMLLGFSAVPQEPARKGADTEAGQLTFNNACRTCHTTKEGDNRLGPNLHNVICSNWVASARARARVMGS